MDPVCEGNGRDEGYDDGQCREYVHDAPHGQEKEVQHHQEEDRAVDMGLEEIQHLQRDFFIDEIIGQAEGSAEDDQDPPHQDHALAHDLG